MASGIETFTHLLKTGGYSITKPRVAVFRALSGHDPLSIHQLTGKVSEIDRASVYRTVDLFERLGIVQRLHTGWKYKLELSDRFAEHHHHLTCTNCSHTVSLNEDELEQLIDQLAAHHGFAPSSHQIEIQGLCATCRKDHSGAAK